LGGGADVLGLLLVAAGLGALAAAITLAARPSVKGLGRVVALSVASFGMLLVLFSFSTNLVLSIALLVLSGFTLMLQMSGSNTLLQTMVPDRMRGRVMSFYTMSLMGIAPFGSLLAGAVATRIGAAHTVAVGGVLCLAGALLFRSHLPSLEAETATIIVDQRATE